MSRFNQKLKDYFSFKRSESIGLSVFIVLIVSILAIPHIYKAFRREEKIDFTMFDKEVKELQSQQAAFSKQVKADAGSKQKGASQYINKGYIPYKYQQIKKSNNFIIELNAADSLELMRLRGIGPVFAKRIIKYRELLGGYCQKEQLLEVWGMDIGRYEGIKDNVTVNRDSVHKININKTAFKRLMKHPYIGYDLSRGILGYIRKQGEFKTIEEVRNIKGLNDSIYKRIEPYIKVR